MLLSDAAETFAKQDGKGARYERAKLRCEFDQIQKTSSRLIAWKSECTGITTTSIKTYILFFVDDFKCFKTYSVSPYDPEDANRQAELINSTISTRQGGFVQQSISNGFDKLIQSISDTVTGTNSVYMRYSYAYFNYSTNKFFKEENLEGGLSWYNRFFEDVMFTIPGQGEYGLAYGNMVDIGKMDDRYIDDDTDEVIAEHDVDAVSKKIKIKKAQTEFYDINHRKTFYIDNVNEYSQKVRIEYSDGTYETVSYDEYLKIMNEGGKDDPNYHPTSTPTKKTKYLGFSGGVHRWDDNGDGIADYTSTSYDRPGWDWSGGASGIADQNAPFANAKNNKVRNMLWDAYNKNNKEWYSQQYRGKTVNGRYCSDCANFNPKNKKAPGICMCSKVKKHIPGHTPACDKFDKAYCRGWYEKEKLYDDGKASANKWSGKETSILDPIFLIILYIILKIFKVV